MAFVYVPNGVNVDRWRSDGEGRDYTLGPTLEPLGAVRDQFQVISGLAHRNGTAGPDGAGDHARATATILTGARPRKTAGADIRAGISVDQFAAQRIGRGTRLPSLELSCDAVRASGACDSGYACAYSYNISWRSESQPATAESNPRLVFERLFGAGRGEERAQSLAARREGRRSVLDFVAEEARGLAAGLDAADRRKLDEYLTGIREIETQLDRFDALPVPQVPDLDLPDGPPPSYGEHMRLMADMLALAFRTDSTRVATLMFAHDGSNRTFPEIGVGDGHHSISHHQDDPEKLTKIAAIDAPGGTFERGVAAALTAMLAAPRFLFRVEQPGAGPIDRGAVPLDDHSLATRLSYLLWSSLPDDDLVEVARAGELHQRLGEQVDRLIADARADRFVADFVGQWLKTRDVETAAFDVREILRSRDQFMAERIFSPRVRAAMRQETELLVARLLRDDRPATDLLVARETFLNSRLARFYGIPGVEGPEMRLVSLAPDSHRGGLLTHASFLAVTSNPTRTSPVKRGLFILENLLGTPTPPPPPDVPPLEAAARSDRRPSMRELMELHRRDALCASCHERMDPLGLALEGYNALGQWRGHDADGLDTSGRLVTGETFADARELAEVIAGPRRRDFHRCLAEKLLTYALGRGLEYFDGPAVDTIVDEMERDGGGLRALVQAVCRSVPFRMMRPPQPAEPSP
jgi:hypothetical protein